MACVLGDLLRAAVESGDWSRVRERLAPDAMLDTSNEAGRRRVEGADAIVAHLGRSGPGAIRDWDAREWPTGVALSFEWEGASGTDRRRWYLRTNSGGEVVELWSTAARPGCGGAGEAVSVPRTLLERIGATRVEPLSHGGNSGAVLLARGPCRRHWVRSQAGRCRRRRLARARHGRPRAHGAAARRWRVRPDAAGDRPRHRGGRAIR